MARQLHIVNGDSTKESLEQSSLGGEIVVWREMLCEGPVSKPVFSDEFWQERYAYFEKELAVPRLDYYDKTIKELMKTEFLEEVDELVLWYEYDLFCQVNLMALCGFLLEHFRKDVQYSMVCVGREKDREGWQTLSDYKPSDYTDLYNNRINMSRASFEYALECWKVYAQKDKNAIRVFNFRKNRRFKYFDVAMKQELKRFPDAHGLSEIDRKILEVIHTGKYKAKDLLKRLLVWQKKDTVYGFGDLQYALRLKKLNAFYEVQKEVLTLNKEGKTLLQLQ